MSNPYENLPRTAFWNQGVATQHPLAPTGLYAPKFVLDRTDRIMTAGSCFAQHVGRQLSGRGFGVLDYEPPPPGLAKAGLAQFGHGMYSARYGNIYTSRQLLQLAGEAFGEFSPQDWVWSRGGRFFDALRPAVEPAGLGSEDEVRAHRAEHLAAVRRLLLDMDVLVFTMGLTEAWAIGGTVFPTAPGVVADGPEAEFVNLSYPQVRDDMESFFALVLRHRGGRGFRTLLTVSPVPLTATASGQHVLPATTYSKATLRAVAGDLVRERADIDYFPSYELVSAPWSRGIYFDANLRTVNQAGADIVMNAFFSAHAPAPEPELDPMFGVLVIEEGEGPRRAAPGQEAPDMQCEEALLEAFGR